MVSSIVPGTPGSLGAVGADTRLSQLAKQKADAANAEGGARSSGDTVQIGGAAAWRAARQSVAAGLEQVQLALEIGREAQGFLAKLGSAAAAYSQDEDAAAQQLSALISGFSERVQEAVQSGSRLLSGEGVSVKAEPGGAPIEIEGLNLNIADNDIAENGVFTFSFSSATASDPAALIQEVDRSRANLQAGLQRLADAAKALETHSGFLGAVSDLEGVNADLDAEGARLLALQVRQDLQGFDGGGIANVEPQAVLALFRN